MTESHVERHLQDVIFDHLHSVEVHEECFIAFDDRVEPHDDFSVPHVYNVYV